MNSFCVGNIKIKLPLRVNTSITNSGVPVGILRNPVNMELWTDYDYLALLANNFKGGNISFALKEWQKITSDSNILGIVKYGLTIRSEAPPMVRGQPVQYNFGRKETDIINNEINLLVEKKVICKSNPEQAGCFSNFYQGK